MFANNQLKRCLAPPLTPLLIPFQMCGKRKNQNNKPEDKKKGRENCVNILRKM